MTVAELIAALQTRPPENLVVIFDSPNGEMTDDEILFHVVDIIDNPYGTNPTKTLIS